MQDEQVMSQGSLTKIGKYEIVATIGESALGIAYQARDPFIGRNVFLKTICAKDFDSDDTTFHFSRLKKEALAAARLNHPGIVTLYEFGEDAGVVFLAMEFVKGRCLQEILAKGERFEVAGAIDLLRQLLEALAYAHDSGVVHRDLNPANIFILQDGRVKVTDFGITKIEATDLTMFGDALGTPYYMSPEIITGHAVDCRTDLFSAGAIFYQLLTGELPFPGRTVHSVMHHILKSEPPPVSALNRQVPAALERVVSKALAKMVQQRFQNAGEFSGALKKAASLSG